MTSTRLSWLDDLWLPLHVIAVRFCWLWPWLAVIRRWLTPSYRDDYVPWWAVLGLLLAATVVSRQALARTSSIRRARAWVGAIGVAAILCLLWWQYAREAYAIVDLRWLRQLVLVLTDLSASLPPQMVSLIIAAGLWLRGVLDGQRQPRHDQVWRTFVTGVFAFILLLLVGRFDPGAAPVHAGRWLITMVAVGMSGLALASLELARYTGAWQAEAQTRLRLNRHWALSVVLVVGGVLVFGLGLAALITPGAVAQVLGWAGFLLRGVLLVLSFVLLALSYVLFLALTPLIEWLRARMALAEPLEMEPMGDMSRQLEELARTAPIQDAGGPSEPLRWLIFFATVLLLAILFALALRLLSGRGQDDEDETRESVFSAALLEQQLRALWQAWRQRLAGRLDETFSPYLSLDGEAGTRRAMRALYQAVLALASSTGRPRPPAHTPHEYTPRLSQVYPPAAESWSTITDAYVAARYGRDAPPPAQLDRMAAAWAHIQSIVANQPATAAAADDSQTVDGADRGDTEIGHGDGQDGAPGDR